MSDAEYEIFLDSIAPATNGDTPEPPAAPAHPDHVRAIDGATFIFQEPAEVPALWGGKETIAWAEGEGLMLCGPDGVGKTSVMQQLLLHRIGLLEGDFLGQPVKQAEGKQLYIAADRPRQASRSFRRMVDEDDFSQESILAERLVVWRGPLPFDVAEKPAFKLADFTEQLGCTSIYVDSLKDVALDLSKDEIGSRVNLAFQECIARGLDICVAHHQRKEQQGGGKPRKIGDVYGSRWLTAGMGSVFMLWGEAGDLVVELGHLKQPADEIGPLTLVHDHRKGVTTLQEKATIEDLLGRAPNGLTANDAAALYFGAEGKATANQVEKARRRLEGMIAQGLAYRNDDPDGRARYFERTA